MQVRDEKQVVLRTGIDVVEQQLAAAERKGVRLSADLPDRPLRFRHDPPRVGQVVTNLLATGAAFGVARLIFQDGRAEGLLGVAQDRLHEKTAFRELGIPTADFEAVDDEASLQSALERLGTPALLKTNPQTFLGCIVQSAQLGLDPSGITGEAYLVPYKDVCTFIIGWRGR